MKILSFVLFAVFMCVSTAHAQKWVRLAEYPEPTEELLGASAGGSSTCSAASLRAGSRWDWSTNTTRDQHVDEEEADAARLPPRFVHGVSRQDYAFGGFGRCNPVPRRGCDR